MQLVAERNISLKQSLLVPTHLNGSFGGQNYQLLRNQQQAIMLDMTNMQHSSSSNIYTSPHLNLDQQFNNNNSQQLSSSFSSSPIVTPATTTTTANATQAHATMMITSGNTTNGAQFNHNHNHSHNNNARDQQQAQQQQQHMFSVLINNKTIKGKA